MTRREISVGCTSAAVAARALVAGARAAPGPKLDEVAGEFVVRAQSPVVLVPEQGGPPGAEVELWLVFVNNPKAEADSRKLQPLDRVRVKGKLGVGGVYRYLIVESIAKDGD